jgi:hypothetical protein
MVAARVARLDFMPPIWSPAHDLRGDYSVFGKRLTYSGRALFDRPRVSKGLVPRGMTDPPGGLQSLRFEGVR